MEKTNITIIGAGVIGLTVAYELSKGCKDIYVLEKNHSFGQETSSRNSEVIHAGIYYPADTLKTKTCIEGKRLLYEFCRKNNVPFNNIGKLIVAVDAGEIKQLESLFKQGQTNGVEGMQMLSEKEIKKLEPAVTARAAIYSPSTGILDTHNFMQKLIMLILGGNVTIAYNTEVYGIEKVDDGFKVTVINDGRENFSFLTKVLINCAGLNADKIGRMTGIISDEYKLKYCKGDYFRVNAKKAGFIQRLVYPVPQPSHAGLGIHATLDLAGGLRLGPDDTYVVGIDYSVDSSKRKAFYESAKKFLPFIKEGDLSADTCGIRPKLQGLNDDFRDFIVRHELEKGLEGFISLVGIESPGFTASLSIAELVRQSVDKIV